MFFCRCWLEERAGILQLATLAGAASSSSSSKWGASRDLVTINEFKHSGPVVVEEWSSMHKHTIRLLSFSDMKTPALRALFVCRHYSATTCRQINQCFSVKIPPPCHWSTCSWHDTALAHLLQPTLAHLMICTADSDQGPYREMKTARWLMYLFPMSCVFFSINIFCRSRE